MAVGMPLGSFLAAVLVLIPLPSHFRARNVATLSIIIWLFVANVIQGINTIIWAHSVEVKFVVWCDIVTRVFIGSNIALPASCFCLCMHLERAASGRVARITHADKRKRMIIDSMLCFAVPMVYMTLYYVVQGHRFDIVEDFGCRPETYVSIPEFFLMRLPPILFSIGTLVFAGLAVVHFVRRRATFAVTLKNSNSSLTPSRYFRLIAMAFVEMVWSLLVSVLNMWFSYAAGLRPWISWANVHSNFSRIGQFPTVLISREALTMTYFLWWAIPASAYLFFAFFAFGQESMKEYKSYIQWFRRVICRRDAQVSKEKFTMSLPSFRLRHTHSTPLSVSISESKIVEPPLTPGSSFEKQLGLRHSTFHISTLSSRSPSETTISDSPHERLSSDPFVPHYHSGQPPASPPTPPSPAHFADQSIRHASSADIV